MAKELLIFKFGSSAITNAKQEIDEKILKNICKQISSFHSTHRIVIISSGAVACGKKYLAPCKDTLLYKRTAAGIGNIFLFSKYQKIFASHGIVVAQALLERKHFSDRHTFLNIRNTFDLYWENNIIPIVNENDVVTDYELRFSDNDDLATRIAICFSAKQLFIGSSVNGVIDDEGKTIQVIHKFSTQIYKFVKSYYEQVSAIGSGGMLSKLNCAKIATSLGTEVVICNAKILNSIVHYQKGEATICPAVEKNISSKRRWIAAGSLTTAKIFIDNIALEFLRERKNLLIVGIKKIEGTFKKGDYVRLFLEHTEEEVGAAKIKLSDNISREEILSLKKDRSLVAANADEIIIYS